MPVSYSIFFDPTVVYIRYSGRVDLNDVKTALGQFAQEGGAVTAQPHLFDFSQVTSYEIDYPQFFELLGQLADVYPQSAGEHLCVFYAPEGPPRELAEIFNKPFDGSETWLIRFAQTRTQAFDILGTQSRDLMAQLNTSP